jgi:hypothetical protein
MGPLGCAKRTGTGEFVGDATLVAVRVAVAGVSVRVAVTGIVAVGVTVTVAGGRVAVGGTALAVAVNVIVGATAVAVASGRVAVAGTVVAVFRTTVAVAVNVAVGPPSRAVVVVANGVSVGSAAKIGLATAHVKPAIIKKIVPRPKPIRLFDISSSVRYEIELDYALSNKSLIIPATYKTGRRNTPSWSHHSFFATQ